MNRKYTVCLGTPEGKMWWLRGGSWGVDPEKALATDYDAARQISGLLKHIYEGDGDQVSAMQVYVSMVRL